VTIGKRWFRIRESKIIIECTGNPPAAVEHCPGSLQSWEARYQRDGGGRRVLRPAARSQGSPGWGHLQSCLWRSTGSCLRTGGTGRTPPAFRLSPLVVGTNGCRTIENPRPTRSGPLGLDGQNRPKVGGLNPKMFNAFLDGSKPAIESAAIANATGLEAPDAGLSFPPGSVDDIPDLMRPKTEGGVLDRKGLVEVISCLRPDGSQIPYDIRKGGLGLHRGGH